MIRECAISLSSGWPLFLAGTQEIEPDLVAKMISPLFQHDYFALSVLLLSLKSL